MLSEMGRRSNKERTNGKRSKIGRPYASPARFEFGLIVDDRNAQVQFVWMSQGCTRDRGLARAERRKEVEDTVTWHTHGAKFIQNLTNRAAHSRCIVVQLLLFIFE